VTGCCGICEAILNPHNVTGLCAECKLIARNARLTGTIGKTYDDTINHLRSQRGPMVLGDAIALVLAELNATVIHTTKENN
jgi:hypothetical protein